MNVCSWVGVEDASWRPWRPVVFCRGVNPSLKQQNHATFGMPRLWGETWTTNLSLNVLISKSKQYQCCTELPPNFAQRTIQNHSGALSHSQHLKLQSLSCLSMSISSHDQLNRTSNRLTTKRKRKAHAKTSLTADCFTSYWRVAISNLFSDLISGLLSSVSIAAHHVDPTTSTHQVFAHLRCKVSSKGCQGQGSAWKTIVLSWRLQQ